MSALTQDQRDDRDALLRRLREIRAEHYPLMVSTLAGYLQLHRDPAVIETALHEAVLLEAERLRNEKQV